MHRQLPQQLITESKLLMSTRLLEIQNEILRRFQNCKNRQFVKRMFYRQMDNLASLQQKISYLMIMLEDIDADRFDTYLYSSMLNDPYYQLEEDTDTSARHDGGRVNTAKMMLMNTNNNKRLSPTTQYHKNTTMTKGLTPANPKHNLFTQARTTAQRANNNNYYSYSQLPIDNTETDQAIISSLQNSTNSHLYKDLIKFHRSKKSQALLASADSMIQNQKILHQLKKLQMEKKLLKYQARRTSPYTQTPMEGLQSKTNYFPQGKEGYVSDYQQQTDVDVESSMDKDTGFKKLSHNNYKTTAPKHSLSSIKQNKNQLKSSNTLNNLFSFRPNSNIKNDRTKETNTRGDLGKNTNKKKAQILPCKFLQQEYEQSQLQRNFSRERQQQRKKYQPYRDEVRGLMSEQDSWLIQRLNRKIRQQDGLNSMLLNSRKHFRVNCEKTLSQYESKLHHLQQQRFLGGKQAQYRANPYGRQQLSDWQLKQRLHQFKNWLNRQSPPSKRNNYQQQQSYHNAKLPKFRINDLNQQLDYDYDVVNKRDFNNGKDYICYSESERRKYGSNDNTPNSMMRECGGDRGKQLQNRGERMFKKKPQLIATQTNYQNNNKRAKNGRGKTKSKSRQLKKASQSKSKSKSKGSPFTRLLNHSPKNPSPTNLRKNHNNHSKQNKKHNDSVSRKEDEGQIEKRASNRLLNRVRSAGCMIGEIPFSREKEDQRQLVNRYLVDGKRQQDVKQKIITTKQAIKTY